MRYLLDTHTMLWFIDGNNALSLQSKQIILNKENSCFLSVVSLWEIAIKISLNKLELSVTFQDLELFLAQNEIEILPLENIHFSHLLQLPFFHRDPFDRILIAQCISENLIFITKDENIQAYSQIKFIW